MVDNLEKLGGLGEKVAPKVEVPPTIDVPDPDYTTQGKKAVNDYILWVYKKLKFCTIAGVVFFLVYVFGILPIGQMSLDYQNVWAGVQDWALAFADVVTAPISALLTILAAEAVRRLVNYAKRQKEAQP